jgi:hypothetical protein
MYLVTAMDLQERLILMLGGKADDDSVTDIRTAIRQALRTVSAEHTWPYYQNYLTLNTNATYTTGTITYTASTRVCTIAGGTWPTWAEQGVVIIDTLHARVETRTSGTSVTINADDAPVDDYTGTFTIYQYQFTLNTDYNIRSVGKIQVDQSNWLEYVNPTCFETDVRRQYLTTGGRPRWFTISRDTQHRGQNVISLWPYPTTALRCRMGYVRHPYDVKTWGYQTGTVNTLTTTAVSGIDTVFNQNHVGCVLRTYSDRVNVPSSTDGRFPWVDQAIVKTVTDATNLVTDAALTTVANDVAYVISDLLDVDNTALYEVVVYAARLELAKLRRVDPKLQMLYQQDYDRALYSAKAQANNDNSARVAGSFRSNNSSWPGLFDSYYTLS